MRLSASSWLFLGLTFTLGCGTAAAKPSAGKLLDEVILKPGNYSQMCMIPAPVSFDVPIPLYSLLAPRFLSVSSANMARLRERRAEIVPEIVRRLNKIDFSPIPKPGSTGFGQYPNQLTGLMLQIILELNTVETLPELLRLEADLNQRLSAATNGSISGLPELDLNSPLGWEGEGRSSPSSADQRQLFTVRIFQRELLSVIAALLRKERFEPILHSDFEAHYRAYLESDSRREELRDIKTPADVPPGESGWITFDPIYKLPVRRVWVAIATVPYTPETRLQIRQIASEFLKATSGKTGGSINGSK